MPRYEFRCRECGATYELRRPMAQSDAPAPCPQGHQDTVKLLSTVAVGGTASAPRGAPRGGPQGSAGAAGGGCCGGGCCA